MIQGKERRLKRDQREIIECDDGNEARETAARRLIESVCGWITIKRCCGTFLVVSGLFGICLAACEGDFSKALIGFATAAAIIAWAFLIIWLLS